MSLLATIILIAFGFLLGSFILMELVEIAWRLSERRMRRRKL